MTRAIKLDCLNSIIEMTKITNKYYSRSKEKTIIRF